MIRRTSALVIAALVAMTSTACDTDADRDPANASDPPAQTTVAKWPNSLAEFRFHWSSGPGIDVAFGAAVPLRAYLESWYVATWTNDADNVYPGFSRATAESDDRDGDYLGQLVFIRPLENVPAHDAESVRPFGYIPFHILTVEPIEKGVRAYVCEGSYAIYFKSSTQPEKFVSVAADKATGTVSDPLDTVYVNRIELSQEDPRIPADASDVDTPQEGPAPAPVGDVFGHWFITGASSSLWGPVDAKPRPDFFVTPEMRGQCQEAMPDSPEKQIEMATGFKDTPPPHGKPIPGWPLAPQ